MMILSWSCMVLLIFLCDEVCPGKDKDKEKVTRKRPTAVSYPYGMRSLDDWVNLGAVVLKKSCETVNLSPSGGIMAMAIRLEEFYHQMAGNAGRGKRVYFYLLLQFGMVHDWIFVIIFQVFMYLSDFLFIICRCSFASPFS